jgi:hypothetical protein
MQFSVPGVGGVGGHDSRCMKTKTSFAKRFTRLLSFSGLALFYNSFSLSIILLSPSLLQKAI